MPSTTTAICTRESGLEQVRFFPGQMLNADDMTQGAEWVRQKLRRLYRHMFGWGIVCGCDVRPPGIDGKAWQVHICPGYLLTPQGDDILIAAEAVFDLAGCFVQSGDPCAFARPCPPIARRTQTTSQVVYLSVRYLECQTRPVRVAPVGCACDDVQCDFSRIREAYEFCCLDSPPATPPTYGCDHLCRGDVLACPDCPPDPAWVLLATITLPLSMDTAITAQNISLAGRPLLYSTAMLQEMALCACAHPAPTPTPTPAPPPPKLPPPAILPPSGVQFQDVQATMVDADALAEIRYTLDATDPSETSALYPGAPVLIQFIHGGGTVVVRARAFRAGFTPSDVTEVQYAFTLIP